MIGGELDDKLYVGHVEGRRNLKKTPDPGDGDGVVPREEDEEDFADGFDGLSKAVAEPVEVLANHAVLVVGEKVEPKVDGGDLVGVLAHGIDIHIHKGIRPGMRDEDGGGGDIQLPVWVPLPDKLVNVGLVGASGFGLDDKLGNLGGR